MSIGHRNMSREERRMVPWVPRLLATSMGVGFLPKAPGTWGALLAIVLWLPLYLFSDQPWIFIMTLTAAIIYLLAGTWASGIAERYWGKDPVAACVDETVGQWIALLPLGNVATTPWWMILLSLGLFRFFDIVKPLGIRRAERLPGGWGMMADDVAAALYSVVILLIINHFYYLP